MLLALHGAMIAAALCGVAGSVLVDRRRRTAAVAAAVVMLAVMVDMAAGFAMLSAPTWTALLVLTAVVSTTGQLWRAPGQVGVALHCGLGAAVMAVLLTLDHPVAPALTPPTHDMATMALGRSTAGPAVAALVLLYLGFSIWTATQHLRSGPDQTGARRRTTAAVVEVAGMAVCVGLMGLSV